MLKPSVMNDAVLYHDYRSGTVRDWSGNDNDGSCIATSWTNDGITVPSSTGYIKVLDSTELRGAEYTVIMLADFMRQKTYLSPVAKRAGGTITFDIQTSSSAVRLYDGTQSTQITADIKGKKCLGMNIKNGEKSELFLDGVSEGLLSANAAITDSDADVYIGGGTIASRNIEDNMRAVLVFTRKLTATEHAQVFGYLSSLTFPTETVRTVSARFDIDPDEPDLVAGYSMELHGGVLVDQGPNGLDGTVFGNGFSTVVDKNGHGILCNATADSRFDIGESYILGNAFTVAAWIQPVVGVQIGICRFGHPLYFEITPSGALRYYCSALSPVSGISGDVVQDQVLIHAGIAYDGANMKFYANGKLADTVACTGSLNESFRYLLSTSFATRMFSGKAYSLKYFRATKPDDWFANEYIQNVGPIVSTGWGAKESRVNSTAGDFIENTPFRVSTGSWQVTLDEINGVPVKVLECKANGICYVEWADLGETNQEGAYGTWEFWLYKSDTALVVFQMFAEKVLPAGTSGNHGMNVYYQGDETMLLRSQTTILIDTDPVTFAHSVWHKVVVTRKTDDTVELFVDDVSYGTVTYTTYKNAIYQVIDGRTGVKIAYSDIKGGHSIVKRDLA